MTIQNTTRKAGPFTNATESPITGPFAFGFKIFALTNLKVVKSTSASATGATTTLAYGTDYTVTADLTTQDTSPGGSITLIGTTKLEPGYFLTILSNIDYSQLTKLTNYDRFMPDTLNDVHDKTVALVQQLKEQNDRTVTVPPTSSTSPDQYIEEIFTARDTAVTKASEASASASSASTSATNATSAKNDAVAAKEAAEDAQEGAEEAKDIAVAAVGDIDALQAVATTLPAGSQATASYSRANHTLTLGLPQGAAGADGADGEDGEDGLDGGSVVDAEVTSGGNLLLTIDPTYTGNIDDEMSTTSVNPVQNKVITAAINNIWPVGSIYMSVLATSPATLFGGTWEALPQGRVLIGAGENYTAGDTGGEATHSITTSEMPSHDHGGASGTVSAGGSHTHSVPVRGGSGGSTAPDPVENSAFWWASTTNNANGMPAHSHTISSQGEGTAMSLMQPYLVVFMWKRTA